MNKNKQENLHRTFKGLSNLLLEFNLDFDDVCKTLREYYVMEAYKVSETITRTSLKVGIDRRTVSAIIKNKKQYYKPSSIFTILNKIKTITEKNKNSFLVKRGDESLESIIFEVANGATTINSVVHELSELGCIKNEEEGIRFITSHISKTPDKQRTLQIFSNHLDRYVSTLVNNLYLKENERNYEYSIFSTKIPPSTNVELHIKIRKLLSETTDELRNLYEKYGQNVPVGTYEEMGVSLTQFNLNRREE